MATLQSFVVDLGSLKKELEGMGKAAPAIMARSLNRAGTAGKTAMVKAVRADTGIAQKNIEREIRLDKATRTVPRFVVSIAGTRIPLIAFQARGPEPSRGKGRGVSYRLPGGRGRIPSAFIATMRSGHRGVFKRKTTRRLPIAELRGPSLPHVFEKFFPAFRSVAEDSLLKNLRHEIDFANRPTGEFPVAPAA